MSLDIGSVSIISGHFAGQDTLDSGSRSNEFTGFAKVFSRNVHLNPILSLYPMPYIPGSYLQPGTYYKTYIHTLIGDIRIYMDYKGIRSIRTSIDI